MESSETDVAAGSPAALEARFNALFAQGYDDVLRYCLRRLPVSDANDAASDVFVVAWRRIDSAPTGDEARLWLYGIARNVVRNSRRSARRSIRLRSKVAGLAPETVEGPEHQVVHRDDLQHALAALAGPWSTQHVAFQDWVDDTNPESFMPMFVSFIDPQRSADLMRQSSQEWLEAGRP